MEHGHDLVYYVLDTCSPLMRVFCDNRPLVRFGQRCQRYRAGRLLRPPSPSQHSHLQLHILALVASSKEEEL